MSGVESVGGAIFFPFLLVDDLSLSDLCSEDVDEDGDVLLIILWMEDDGDEAEAAEAVVVSELGSELKEEFWVTCLGDSGSKPRKL